MKETTVRPVVESDLKEIYRYISKEFRSYNGGHKLSYLDVLIRFEDGFYSSSFAVYCGSVLSGFIIPYGNRRDIKYVSILYLKKFKVPYLLQAALVVCFDKLSLHSALFETNLKFVCKYYKKLGVQVVNFPNGISLITNPQIDSLFFKEGIPMDVSQ